MKLVRQEVDGAILSTSQQAHVNLWLVMFLGMHLESASKQWGFLHTSYAATASTESFPIGFPEACYAIVITPTRNGTYNGLYNKFPSIISNTLTSFIWGMSEQGGEAYATYLAIGE